jgi:hypothetical protein
MRNYWLERQNERLIAPVYGQCEASFTKCDVACSGGDYTFMTTIEPGYLGMSYTHECCINPIDFKNIVWDTLLGAIDLSVTITV